MKLIIIDVIDNKTGEISRTDLYPIVSLDKRVTDIFGLRDKGLHIPTLVRTGVAEFSPPLSDETWRASLSKQGTFLVAGGSDV